MKQLVPLLGVNFIGTLGLSIVLPFLVVIVESFGGNGVVYGLIASTYPFFQLLASPVLGRWSDLFGRKRVLLVSQLGTLAAWIVFLLALLIPPTRLGESDSSLLGSFTVTVPLLLVFAARALDGATGGNVSVANAYLADVSTDETRNRNFGLLSMSSNLGFILGPALAGLLGVTALGAILPVSTALGISVIGAVAIAAFLPRVVGGEAGGADEASDAPSNAESVESHGLDGDSGKRPPPHCPQAASTSVDDTESATGRRVVAESRKHGLRALLGFPKVGLFLALYFMLYLGFNIFYAAFPVHATAGFLWTSAQLGAFFSILSVMMLVVQGPVLRWASKRFSEGFLILAGSAILAANFLLLSFNDPLLAYGAAVLFALGNGLMWPSFLSLLASAVDSSHQGEVQGYGASAGSLASIIGLVLGGLLYETIGASAFVVSFGCVMLVVFLSVGLVRPSGAKAKA
jgi:MFS family permease